MIGPLGPLTRAHVCPVAGHPACVDPPTVLAAVEALSGASGRSRTGRRPRPVGRPA
ncbi:hypothetical protein [Pseudonocardia sulfidoxydans]|uniref:hypothetical protein n=1 Tax=Pseudonocardia sulfidoxydans TaxID=54011 RepID=UPI001C99E77E|nr:hypothetical protein [Pseudonocardia sulfidoxydans]